LCFPSSLSSRQSRFGPYGGGTPFRGAGGGAFVAADPILTSVNYEETPATKQHGSRAVRRFFRTLFDGWTDWMGAVGVRP